MGKTIWMSSSASAATVASDYTLGGNGSAADPLGVQYPVFLKTLAASITVVADTVLLAHDGLIPDGLEVLIEDGAEVLTL